MSKAKQLLKKMEGINGSQVIVAFQNLKDAEKFYDKAKKSVMYREVDEPEKFDGDITVVVTPKSGREAEDSITVLAKEFDGEIIHL